MYEKPGLNLTNFTLWGILNHSDLSWGECKYYKSDGNDNNNCYLLRYPKICSNINNAPFELGFYYQYEPHIKIKKHNINAWSFEGFIVSIADEISQRHHDMEDALNMGIIDTKELVDVIKVYLGDYITDGEMQSNSIHRKILSKQEKIDQMPVFLPYLSKLVVDLYTNLLIKNSIQNLHKFTNDNNIKGRRDFIDLYPNISEEEAKQIIAFPKVFKEKDRELQHFLRNRILKSYKAQQMDGKGSFIIRRLFKAYITNPCQLQDTTIVSIFRIYEKSIINNMDEFNKAKIGHLRNEIDAAKYKSDPRFQISLLRAVYDFISGMTDDYAYTIHEQLYG